MIFIIEGPDGSGKTTLAKRLAAKTGWPYVHMSNPKTEEEMVEMANEYKKLLREHRNLILDRAWYSEMAYGPTMRGKTAIDYPTMFSLERLAASRGGAMIIYCTDSAAWLWKRCQERGEDYVLHKEDFVDICAEFDRIMSAPHLIPVVRYGYEDL